MVINNSSNIKDLVVSSNNISHVYKGNDVVYQRQILPAGYTELQYLQGDGTAYIDTGVTVTNTTGYRFYFQKQSNRTTEECIGGCRNASLMRSFASVLSGSLYAGWNTQFENTLKLISDSSVYNIKFNYLNSRQIIVGQDYIYQLSFESNPNLNAYLFGCNANGTASWVTGGKLYKCVITQGSSIVRNFIPCISINNEFGLYDTVTNRFFKNAASSGSFTGEINVAKLHKVKRDIRQSMLNHGFISTLGAYKDFKGELIDEIAMDHSVEIALDWNNWCRNSTDKSVYNHFNYLLKDKNFKYFPIVELPSRVTSLFCLFGNTSSSSVASELRYCDLSNWNVKNVTNFKSLFARCQKLKMVDISTWTVENAIDLSYLFYVCNSLTGTLDLHLFNTSKCTWFSEMIVAPITSLKINLNLTSRNLESNQYGGNIACNQLTQITGTFSNIKNNFYCGWLLYIDRSSALIILNGLSDLTGLATLTLTLHLSIRSKLTDADKAIATNKNWTLVFA